MIKRRLITTAIVTLIVAGIFTGCGKKEASNTVTNTETKVVAEQTTKQTEATTKQAETITTENITEAASTEEAATQDTVSVDVAVNDTPVTDNNDNNGGNSADNDNNSSDTPTQQPDVPDTPSYEPEPTPEPTPEPEPEPAEPEVNYIPCKSYFDNRDLTEIWAITWDTITPTSNKYIYYRIRIGEKGGIIYQYFFFNESIDTAVMLAETYNSDVEQQTKIYVDSFDNTLPYLVY